MNPEQTPYNPQQQPEQPQPAAQAQPVATQPVPQPQQFAQPAQQQFAQPAPQAQPQQFAQPAPQQFAQPTPAQATNPDQFAKKTKNAGRSIFALGVFVTVLAAIAGLATVAGASSEEMPALYLVLTLIGLGVYLAGAIVMINKGRALKRATNLHEAERAINTALIASGALLLVDVIMSVLSASGLRLIGLLSLVTIIYLLVAKSGLKKVA